MIEIVIREGLEEAIDSSDIETILQDFLTHLFEGERSLSVYLTDDEEIHQFNLKQRGMDRPTDILSWSYYEEDPEVEWVGDLMLSLPRIQLQAEENGWDLRTELVRMLAHGCAHLAGWDHERSVEEAESMLSLIHI